MRDTATEVRDTAIRAYRESRAWARTSVGRVRQRWRTATPRERQTLGLTVGSAALGLVVAVTAVAASGPWDSGQRTAERARAVAQDRGSGGKHIGGGPDTGTGGAASSGAPEVLTPVGAGVDSDSARGPGADTVPPPTSSALADIMKPLLKDDALGKVRSASVMDAGESRQVFKSDPETPVTPASTVKLATAAAALSARGPGHRMETRVVQGDGDRVVLVGGGDPALSEEQLGELAADTARKLRGKGTDEVSLGYDTSLYSGPETHSIGPNDNLAPVTPLMAGQARIDNSEHGPAPREADPAAEAAAAFRKELDRRGVEVADAAKSVRAPAKSAELASHSSAPLSVLAEQMLTHSDNDIAEALARQTALATGRPASFEGAGDAVERRLAALDMPLKGVRIADGSGLDRDDKVTAAFLTRLLARAADPDEPELRPILTGLPVARFTGTLGDRYGDEKGSTGAGVVRAKTGTLTGVNTLAGTVVDADGRLLVYAFMTSGTTDQDAAQTALDRMASALANCGCRDSPSAG